MSSKKKFVSILSDFGFKRAFGNRINTVFLKHALQILIQASIPIAEVRFEDRVFEGTVKKRRGGSFDITCTDENGRVFIVEMQRREIERFIHRGKFYAFKRLDRMVKKGKYKFDDLKTIYLISFLEGKVYPTVEFHHFACLRNQHGELIDDQITHVILELEKWNKTEEELETDLDKLIFLMKYTDTATVNDPIPEVITKTEWMKHLLHTLELENLTDAERDAYEKDAINTALAISIEERDEKERQKTAQMKLEAKQMKQEAKQMKQEAKQIEQEAKQIAKKNEKTKDNLIEKLLIMGTDSDQEVADFFKVSIERIQRIKQQLKDK